MRYIYQHSNWPHFTWNQEEIIQELISVKFHHGRLLGNMENLGFDTQEEAILAILTSEVIKSSEIEGEKLNTEEVRSSVARHLGMDIAGLLPSDRHVDGIVEMTVDATQNYKKPLTKQRLCHWHAALFPTGLSGMMLVNPGMLRNDREGPMQVVLGRYGRERVHFQAPPAKQLPRDIKQFVQWFNQSPATMDPFVQAAIAHLWFVTLHPFDDGNGRIARAITDMALAKAEAQASRFYSMSTQIRKQHTSYYEILERTQKGTLNITPWLRWFLDCLQGAVVQSESILKNILNKTRFWEKHSGKSLNKRQITMINILFGNFTGKLTSSKWAKMMKCSQDTAARDINNLIAQGILIKSKESGRSTSYLIRNSPASSTSADQS